MTIAELITALSEMPPDWEVALDDLHCGRTAHTFTIETPDYTPGIVWLVDAA